MTEWMNKNRFGVCACVWMHLKGKFIDLRISVGPSLYVFFMFLQNNWKFCNETPRAVFNTPWNCNMLLGLLCNVSVFRYEWDLTTYYYSFSFFCISLFFRTFAIVVIVESSCCFMDTFQLTKSMCCIFY